MNFDNNLIDKDTPIIQLEKSTLTKKEKKLIFGDTKNYSKKSLNHYLNMIYFYQNRYMYFKEKISMDELLGTYIAKKIGLQTITYKIARTEHLGIASFNFKNEKNNYFYTDTLPVMILTYGMSLQNIENLTTLCIDEKNKENFLNHLFQLFSLDIYMAQQDRHILNLQFEQNKITNYFDLAPVYDFSCCANKFDGVLYNPIFGLCGTSISLLIKEYPEFYDILNSTFQMNMVELMEQIGKDYQFNQGFAFQNMLDFYEIKQKNQKKYLKTLTK